MCQTYGPTILQDDSFEMKLKVQVPFLSDQKFKDNLSPPHTPFSLKEYDQNLGMDILFKIVIQARKKVTQARNFS